jgi:hypothetical protein
VNRMCLVSTNPSAHLTCWIPCLFSQLSTLNSQLPFLNSQLSAGSRLAGTFLTPTPHTLAGETPALQLDFQRHDLT